MRCLYLTLDLSSFIVPFAFSFHPRLAFYKNWKSAWLAILLAASIFVIWDINFTQLRVWGFNPAYLTGINFFNLPLEEVLFFICIPYSCLFTYHCLNVLVSKDIFAKAEIWITAILVLFLTAFAGLNNSKLYTSATFFSLVALLLFLKFVLKAKWLSRFYFSYMVLLIPFSIVNGILTGTGINRPVVWYNDHENMGIRLGTIPVEDIFYGMLLILLTVTFYESFRRKEDA